MDDITRYIETMNRLQDAINPPAIRAIREQNTAIQNALSISPIIQKILDNSNGMYAALNALAQNLKRSQQIKLQNPNAQFQNNPKYVKNDCSIKHS